MSDLETDLKDLVTDELIEVAWYASYPINPSIGLWSFIQAFRNGSFVVDVDNGNRNFYTEENGLCRLCLYVDLGLDSWDSCLEDSDSRGRVVLVSPEGSKKI